MTENFMVINGERFRVINAWTETEASDGRKRWGIVTEPMVPDDAPAPLSITQCPGGAPCPLRAAWPKAETQGRWGADPEPAPRETEEQPAPPADATAPRCDSHECMSPNCAFPGKCVRVKVADATREAWIERPSGAPVRVLVDGPGCTPAAVSVPCLGESCTGCSDPQCWTARADGGDA